MADLIYCGTEKVSAANTLELIAGPYAAVWSPPMWRAATPTEDDTLWLLWRGGEAATPQLLAKGRVICPGGGRCDWTNSSAHGIVAAARALGYDGPTNMAFLRLTDVAVFSQLPQVVGLGKVAIGLSAPSPDQLEALNRVTQVDTASRLDPSAESPSSTAATRQLDLQGRSAGQMQRGPRLEPLGEELPYDMGNAGDLIKHGVLAEFARWWCEHGSPPLRLRFLDPFAGRPWTSAPHPLVVQRFSRLTDCALVQAQRDMPSRYYGSSYVVFNATVAAGGEPQVLVSDANANARAAFQESPLGYIEASGFSHQDGYSILDAEFHADLILLDPFADFLPNYAQQVIPKLGRISDRVACVLFVLNRDPSNVVGAGYQALRDRRLRNAWAITCPPLPDEEVRGESKYEVEVLLVWDGLADHPDAEQLWSRLKAFCEQVSTILDVSLRMSRRETLDIDNQRNRR